MTLWPCAKPSGGRRGCRNLRHPSEVQLHGKEFHPRLVGVTEDFEKIRNLQIISGRYFDSQDFLGHFKVCLITEHMAQAAFGLDRAIGNIIQLDQFRCTLIGTFKEGVPTFGQSEIQDDTLLVPFPLVKAITGDNFFQVLYAQATSSIEVPDLTRQMSDLFGSAIARRHVTRSRICPLSFRRRAEYRSL